MQKGSEKEEMEIWIGKTGLQRILFGFLVYFLVVSAEAADNKGLKIWPMPKSVSYGDGSLYFSDDFELKTDGSNYTDSNGILKDAFLRLIDVVKDSHVIEVNSSSLDPSLVLKGIHVVVFSPSDELQYGIDESYTLDIPAPESSLYAHLQFPRGVDEPYKLNNPEYGNLRRELLDIAANGSPLYARLEAQTVYGALHGLQTFSQVCRFNFTSRGIVVHQVPLTIVDEPRFLYRGLLIDTSRHYQPLKMIKKVIDSMTYAKLNVLHWHIVDEESFPLEIPSYPKLWDGAYSVSERYTMAEAAAIVSYAKKRGINVLAELDVPGHASSWGAGYPSLWPSANCQEPLDVSNEFTFQLIDGILSDFSKIFKYKFIHLGGDEVNTSCWNSTPHVNKWLSEKGMSGADAYQYFVLRAQKIALSYGYEIINWEETFNNFGDKLDGKTVVHNWLGGGVCQRVTEAGLRCIMSNQDKWYLDHLDAFWQGYYSNEPLTNITDPEQQALVLGGEVCAWGEHIDASDLEQTIWPRAAAAAERLWTPYDKVAKDPEEVRSRLSHFRCLLNQRGVAAAPLEGFGRAAPDDPGSCFSQ